LTPIGEEEMMGENLVWTAYGFTGLILAVTLPGLAIVIAASIAIGAAVSYLTTNRR
jgi:hypothetical protein